MTPGAVSGQGSIAAPANAAAPSDPYFPAHAMRRPDELAPRGRESTMRRRAASIGRIANWIALLVGCLLTGPVRADSPAIEWHDGLLSVHAHHTDRRTLLRAVARMTHTPIDGLEYATDSLDLDMTDVPLRSALQAMVGLFSYALTEFERDEDSTATRYTVRINGPRPPRPTDMPMAAPGWSASTAGGGTSDRPLTTTSGSPSSPPGMAMPVMAAPSGDAERTTPPAQSRPPGPPTGAPGQPALPDPVR